MASSQVTKRRKSAAPSKVAAAKVAAAKAAAKAATTAASVTSPAASGPQTRGPGTPGNAVSTPVKEAANAGLEARNEALAFLECPTFAEATHVPALYCLDSSRRAPPVREMGARAGASIVDGVSPFEVVDLSDPKSILQSGFRAEDLLGEDPSTLLRGPGSMGRVPVDKQTSAKVDKTGAKDLAPAGLKNLGATCYLNSLLQYLFFNVDFRRGLLAASSQSEALRALQQVFGQLELGHRGVVDPSAFVTAARIDAVEQADATEFSALLLDWLERELNASKPEEDAACGRGGDFIPKLFRGEVSQSLRCLADPSHVFERREHFYELQARLEADTTPAVRSEAGGCEAAVATIEATPNEGGAGTSGSEAKNAKRTSGGPAARKKNQPPIVWLEKLLEDTTFPEEVLDGANQYHCPKCDQKVNAKKATKPAKLPPFLHITLERYFYDLKKLERRKLNHIVSFPRRLELRVSSTCEQKVSASPVKDSSSDASTMPVVYECIGYLEHVSDSAQSGHYTATLLQEDSNTATAAVGDAGSLPVSRVKSVSAAGDESEPAKKRQCCSADAAAGVPSGRTWWKLDDDTVSRVTWVLSDQTPDAADGGSAARAASSAAAAAECARGSPRRIESAGAYLLLYRRTDYVPGSVRPGPVQVPASVAELVSADNCDLIARRRKYDEKARLTKSFLADRQRTLLTLAQALREVEVPESLSDSGSMNFKGLSVVPTSWLNMLLRGEDLCRDDMLPPTSMDGKFVTAPFPTYGSALQIKDGERQVLNPLALWCGQVKLVPTAALQSHALRGLGGIDSTLFIDAEECMDSETCNAVWKVFQAWRDEREQLAQLVQSKLSMAEARALQSQGRGDEAVWLSTKLLNAWRKSLTAVGQQHGPALQKNWCLFLEEVRAAMSDSDGLDALSAAAEAANADAGGDGKQRREVPQALPGSGVSAMDVVQLTDGIVCAHGLLSKPRSATCVPRAEASRLLELSRAKAERYRELWLDACVPCMRSGVPGERLLSLDDVCQECIRSTVSGAVTKVDPPDAPMSRREITVRQRYASGNVRKRGSISVPLDDSTPVTGASVSKLVLSTLGLPVARLFVKEDGDAPEVEIESGSSVQRTVNTVIVEKDENAVPPEREAAAFESCIFRAA